MDDNKEWMEQRKSKRIQCQSEIDYMISCVEDSIKLRKRI